MEMASRRNENLAVFIQHNPERDTQKQVKTKYP